MSSAPDDFLSPAGVKRLTGLERPSAQLRWCVKNGVRAWLSAANEVIVPKSAIDGGKAEAPESWAPDYDPIRKRA